MAVSKAIIDVVSVRACVGAAVAHVFAPIQSAWLSGREAGGVR